MIHQISLRTYFYIYFSIGLLSLVGHPALAQINFDFQQGKFLIKGQVKDVQTGNNLPLANIRITNSGKGITCDNEGRFAIYVSKSDTLRISTIGYLAKIIHVADIDSMSYYTLEIGLFKDVVNMKTITIYPYRDLDDFKKAFTEATTQNKVTLPGIASPKYSNVVPKAKLTNPISFLYDRVKQKRAANPDFKP